MANNEEISTKIIDITDDQFDSEVKGSNIPVLLDFWAPWCAPCKALTPILEKVSVHFGKKIKIAKVNVDNNKKISAALGIRGIPTIMLFNGGDNIATRVGVIQADDLINLIESHIS